MAKKINMFSRVIYWVVGLTGVSALLWAVFNITEFSQMPFFANVMYLILTIGGLNWLVVAITGKRTKDLFGLLGL